MGETSWKYEVCGKVSYPKAPTLETDVWSLPLAGMELLAISALECVWVCRHDQSIEWIVWDCHRGFISRHESLFDQEMNHCALAYTGSNTLQKRGTVWLSLSSYGINSSSSFFLSICSKWFDIVEIRKLIVWDISPTHGYGVFGCWLSAADERFLQQFTPITCGSFNHYDKTWTPYQRIIHY